MAWVKQNIDLDPLTVEMRERVPVAGIGGASGFTTRRIGDDECHVRIIIDTGKIREFARRAAENKSGRAVLQGGAIVAELVSRRPLNRETTRTLTGETA